MRTIQARLASAGSLLCFVLLVFAGTNAQAAISGTSSIEWRVCEAKIVAIGRITEVKTTIGGSVQYEDAVLEVSEHIKGSDDKQIHFTFRHLTDKHEKWDYPKGDVLVFLIIPKSPFTDEQIKGYAARGDPYDFDSVRMHKKLVLMGNGDNLIGYSIIPLTNPIDDVYDRKMQSVTDKDDMLNICRKWGESPITHSIQMDVPFGTPLHKRYYAMSAVLFVVPAEEHFRSHYLAYAKSADKGERQQAAWELHKFPGDETEAVLRKLLDDKTETIWTYLPDSIAEIKYEIRSGAYHGLKHLGKSVPEDLVLKRKPTEEEQSKYRIQHWGDRFKRVAQDGWKVKSIEILEVRKSGGEGERESASILVSATSGASDFAIVIVPWDWEIRELPDARMIGYDSDLRQSDTRVFFVKGSPSKEVIEHLQTQFRIRYYSSKNK